MQYPYYFCYSYHVFTYVIYSIIHLVFYIRKSILLVKYFIYAHIVLVLLLLLVNQDFCSVIFNLILKNFFGNRVAQCIMVKLENHGAVY